MKVLHEIVPINNEDMFIILNHPNAKFDYGLHCHPEYEINLVLGTHGTRVVGDSTEEFGEMDLVIVGSNMPHMWMADPSENIQITIQFSADLLKYQIMSKRSFAPIRQMLIDAQQGLQFTGPEGNLIKDKILELTKMQGFQTTMQFLNILNMMATSGRRVLVSNMYDLSNIILTSKSRRIAKVCEHIEKNITQDLSLSEVAALVNMSESAFSHFFKKRTGITYINYVTNLRIAKACNLLADTTHSASEICYDCGFNNISNFIRIFTKKKGMTPIEYRKYITQLITKY